MFVARVPLPPGDRAAIAVSDPWSYAELGEAVEAWGFRYLQHEQRFCDRAEIARRWFADEYTPVVRMLREADLLGVEHRGRGLPAGHRRALPADPHPRVERRGDPPPPRGATSAPDAAAARRRGWCRGRDGSGCRVGRGRWRGSGSGRWPDRRRGCVRVSTHSSAVSPSRDLGGGVEAGDDLVGVGADVGPARVPGQLRRARRSRPGRPRARSRRRRPSPSTRPRRSTPGR